MRSKKGRFMPHFGVTPFQVRIQLRFLTLDFFSRRAGVFTNQESSLRPLVPLSGGSLENFKFKCFVRNYSSQILS